MKVLKRAPMETLHHGPAGSPSPTLREAVAKIAAKVATLLRWTNVKNAATDQNAKRRETAGVDGGGSSPEEAATRIVLALRLEAGDARFQEFHAAIREAVATHDMAPIERFVETCKSSYFPKKRNEVDPRGEKGLFGWLEQDADEPTETGKTARKYLEVRRAVGLETPEGDNDLSFCVTRMINYVTTARAKSSGRNVAA